MRFLALVFSLVLAACGGGGSTSLVEKEESAVLSKVLGVYQNGIDYYHKNEYIILNNIWGIKPEMNLTANRDYYSEISYYQSSLENRVKFTWSFPNNLIDDRGAAVYAYPEIAWGKPLPLSGYGNASAAISQIQNLTSFKVDYSVSLSGDLSSYSLMHDLWVFDNRGDIVGELGIYPMANEWTLRWCGVNGYFANLPGSTTYRYDETGVLYNLVVAWTTNPQGNVSRVYLMTPVINNQSTIQTGSVNVHKVLQFLVSVGELDPTNFIRGIEFGNEIHKGTGSMIVNNYKVFMTNR